MNNSAPKDFSLFDRPQVLRFLFHPRADQEASTGPFSRLEIPVDPGVHVDGKFFAVSPNAPTILFFHGNGEIVSDYDDLGYIYREMGINFLPVDYRGYGRSTGVPTVTAMMKDCHAIFRFVRDYLGREGYSGILAVMGRSLGSASALELAHQHPDEIDALIIESGFAHIIPLLHLLGINAGALGITDDLFEHRDKISTYRGPTLVIHAEFDHIIPFSDGQELFAASADTDKSFLMIPGANHNTIFARGLDAYMKNVHDLLDRAGHEK